MRQIKPKPPCTKECVNRKAGCRSECEPFIKYDRERIEFTKWMQDEREKERRTHTERSRK